MALTAPSVTETRDAGAVRAAAGAITVTTVAVLPVFLTGALAVQISGELGFDPAGLGLVVALYFGISAVCSLPVGRLVERRGGVVTSRLAVLGVAVMMLALAGLARSYVSPVVILMAGAWCNVMGQLASNLTLARSVPAHRLGLSFGVKQAAVPLATLLAGAAVPVVALTIGWRWAYVIAAGLALLAMLGVPRGGVPHVPTPKPPPGERATLALAVLGAGSGLGAGAANALGIFLVAAAVDRGIAPGTAGARADLRQRRRVRRPAAARLARRPACGRPRRVRRRGAWRSARSGSRCSRCPGLPRWWSGRSSASGWAGRGRA